MHRAVRLLAGVVHAVAVIPLHQSARCTGRCGLPSLTTQQRHEQVASISPMHRAVRPRSSSSITHRSAWLHQSARCTGRCGIKLMVWVNPDHIVASISPMHSSAPGPGWLPGRCPSDHIVASISPMHRAVRLPISPQLAHRDVRCINQPDAQGGAASFLALAKGCVSTVASISPMHRAVRPASAGQGDGRPVRRCINQPDAQGGAASKCRARRWSARASLHQSARCTGRCGPEPLLSEPTHPAVASISPMHRAVRPRAAPIRAHPPRRCINQPDAQGGAACGYSIRARHVCAGCINQPDAQGGAAPWNQSHHNHHQPVASISPMHRAVRRRGRHASRRLKRRCINQPDAQGGAAP